MEATQSEDKAETLLQAYAAQRHGDDPRRALDLDDFVRFLNASGVARVRVVHEAWLPSDIDGMIRLADDKTTEVVVGPGTPRRQRFTTAHELGHVVFGHPIGSLRNELSTKGTEANELAANRFAAALLMPRERFSTDMAGSSVSALAEMYEVSTDAVNYRIKALGYAEPALDPVPRRPGPESSRPVISQWWTPSGVLDWDGLLGAVVANEPGQDDAYTFQRAVPPLLEAIFSGQLIEPQSEVSIANGTKRIDARFVNANEKGFYRWFTEVVQKPAATIPVECKNYRQEVGNVEIAQIAGRLNKHRGLLGLLVCRQVRDRTLLVNKAREELHDTGRYIIVLDDEILRELVREARSGAVDAVTQRMIRLYLELIN